MKKIMFMPDTHFPYHDRKAYRVFLNAMDHFAPDVVGILGDTTDFYSISMYDRDPERSWRLADEIGVANRELDTIGARRVFYCEGNHEHRLTRYLAKHPELSGLISARKLLEVDRRGWGWYPYKDFCKIGKLYVTHDVGHAGKNAIRLTVDAAQANIVIGHVHRIGYQIVRSLRGESHLAMCPGWLGSFDAVDYMYRVKMRDWHHGFGVGYIRQNGDAHVHPVPIVGGGAMVEGKWVRA